MSVEANKAAFRGAIAAYNDPARRESYFDLYASTATVHGYPGMGPGFEGLRAFYRAFWAAFPDATFLEDLLFGEGDLLACCFRVRGTQRGDFLGVPGSGRAVLFPGITVLRFENGRCIERWSQADYLGLAQQLGVSPLPR